MQSSFSPPHKPTYQFFGAYRFLLALLVMFDHAYIAFFDDPKQMPLGHPGGTAVMLFYVLSGFVVAEALSTYYRGRLRAFFMNRCLRILPPYYLALTLAYWIYLIMAILNLPHPDSGFNSFDTIGLRSLTLNLLAPFDSAVAQLNAPYYLIVRTAWSLVIEWQFYIGLVLALALYPNTNLTFRRVCQMAAICFSLYAALQFPAFSHYIPFELNRTLFSYSPYFILGISMYFFYSTRAHGMRLCAGTMCALCLGIIIYDASTWEYPSWLILAGVALQAVLTRYSEKLQHLKPWKKVDVALGQLSFPLYLNHYIALVLYYAVSQSTGWLALLLASCFAIALSALAYVAIEPWIAKYRNSIRGAALYG